MTIKNKAIKLSEKSDAECYFCKKPTAYALQDGKTGEEVWCCKKCLWEKGKINKFKPKRYKVSEKGRSAKIEPLLSVKMKVTSPIKEYPEVLIS